uniref:Ig-like domain-containing protein n=1 Tax=Esox lucius TaxID=8010 RepID=A0AAY5KVS0_ESOLU
MEYLYCVYFCETFLFSVSVSGQNLYQDQISETKKKGQNVSFKCRITGQCRSNYIYWYQKKDGEPFTFRDNSGSSELTIQSVDESHSATYYCACYQSSGTHIFGSGTRLYVTDDPIKTPKLTVYPASEPEPNGKTTLLCLASGMFPDIVKISWKMKDKTGRTIEVPKGEEVQQRDERKTTSMIIIDKVKAVENNLICSVKHEGGNNEVETPQGKPISLALLFFSSPDSFQSMVSLNLASLAYTLMIVKSLVYCCGLAVLLQLRNKGSRPSSLYIY